MNIWQRRYIRSRLQRMHYKLRRADDKVTAEVVRELIRLIAKELV